MAFADPLEDRLNNLMTKMEEQQAAGPLTMKELLNYLMNIIVTVGVPIALVWYRKNSNIMNDVAMNQSITNQSSRLGADLLDILQSRGVQTADVHPNDPSVAALATTLRENYPQFSKALGMTQEKAAAYIIKEAKKQDPNIAPIRQPMVLS